MVQTPEQSSQDKFSPAIVSFHRLNGSFDVRTDFCWRHFAVALHCIYQNALPTIVLDTQAHCWRLPQNFAFLYNYAANGHGVDILGHVHGILSASTDQLAAAWVHCRRQPSSVSSSLLCQVRSPTSTSARFNFMISLYDGFKCLRIIIIICVLHHIHRTFYHIYIHIAGGLAERVLPQNLAQLMHGRCYLLK